MPVRTGRHTAEPELTRCGQEVAQLAERAGLAGSPRVRRAEWYRSDIRTAETRVRRRGRATIVVSRRLLDATDAERRGVLAHEMCHARWDRPGLAWWGWTTMTVTAAPIIAGAWWGTTAAGPVMAEVRAVGGFLVSVALLGVWVVLVAPRARVDPLPSLVRELRCDLLAVDLTSRGEVIAGLLLLARLEPATPPRVRLGGLSHPDTMDRARAMSAYPGGERADPVQFAVRFLLERAHHQPTGRARRRIAGLVTPGL